LVRCDDVDDPFAMDDPFADDPISAPEPEPEPVVVTETAAEFTPSKESVPKATAVQRKAVEFKGFDVADESDPDSPSPFVADGARPKKEKDLSFGGFDKEDEQYAESAFGAPAEKDDEAASIFAADQHHLPFARGFDEDKKTKDMTPTPAAPATDEASSLEASLQSLQTADEDDAFLSSLAQPRQTAKAKAKAPVMKDGAAENTKAKQAMSLLDDDLFSMGGGSSSAAADAGDDFDFGSYIASNKAGASSGGLFD